MNRRTFIRTSFGAAIGAQVSALAAEEARLKAPFRFLYSNDTTNTTSCSSPWHQAGEAFRPEMLEASIDEVSGMGIDAHLLQPGLGDIPMWPSKVYPLDVHYAWLKRTYGLSPDTFGKYLLEGGDLLKVFIDRCRLRGQAPFVSIRLNDAHHKEWVDSPPGEKIAGGAAMALTPFYRDHPEYRIGPNLKSATQHVLNWAIPEVRAHKLALIRELCENYDVAGLELDFLRYYSFFIHAKTTRAQRCEIMTGFMREVRAILDQTTHNGQRRWLCARVPCFLTLHDTLGIDLPAMVAAGLEMINAPAHYFTVQQNDLAAIRALVPQARVYSELCHSTWNGEALAAGYDRFTFRRTTREQFQTAAHLAYARGADGISLFNFAYFRAHGAPERGPFQEPPFSLLPRLADKQWLSRQPQHYFLAPGWAEPVVGVPALPRVVAAGETIRFQLDLAPPLGGWQSPARLRIQTAAPDARLQARFNAVALLSSPDLSEPFPNPSPSLLGTPQTLHAWTIADLNPGKNLLEVINLGATSTLLFVDLATK